MKIIGVIPSRYASTRLPAKPLADILGKPMVVRVYERARSCPSLDELYVATDDSRIMDVCSTYDVPAVLTDVNHQSGTDRIFEAVQGKGAGIVVNIQGDEPLLDPGMLEVLIAPLKTFKPEEAAVASLCCPITEKEEYQNPNAVKVVKSVSDKALYFSRSPLPFGRDRDLPERMYKHLGFYAYTIAALEAFSVMEQGYLERMEKLEQLRFLEADIPIFMSYVEKNTIAVDTQEDLDRVREIYTNLVSE